MATPTQLSAPEQDTLVKQIGLALLRAAPRDWKRISANYRTVGRYHELDGEVTRADGSTAEWVATHDIATLFGRLRSGMYREGRGTWSNARYTLEAPASYNLEYDREEPEWKLLPPSQAYADELRMFPRTDENVPDWLMRRLAGLGPERPGPRMRIARVFDRTDESGRPVINRPELPEDEQDQVLEYLESAPVVLPGRGFDLDRLATAPEPTVPVGFSSDGTWIWPAAATYYLQEYGVTPDQELVEHIRANDYRVPEVSDEQQDAAKEYLTRSDAAPAQPAAMAPPPIPRAAQPMQPSQPAQPSQPEPPGRHSASSEDEGRNGMEATQVWQMPAGPAAGAAGLAGAAAAGSVADDEAAHREAQADIGTQYFNPIAEDDPDAEDLPTGSATEGHFVDEVPATEQAAEPAPAAPGGAPDEPALQRLRDQLDELGVPATEYRIGGPTKLGWALEEVPEGWRVGWYADSLTDSSVFGDPADAAAFMLGKVLLEPNGRIDAEPAEPEPGRHEADAEDFAPLPADFAPPAHQPDFSELEPEPEPPEPPAATKPDMPAVGGGMGGVGMAGAAGAAAAGLAGAAAGGLEEPPQLGRPQPAATEPHPLPPPPAAPEPPAPAPAPARSPAAGVPSSGAPSAPGNWPIQPLPGEPPLTLFRGKHMVDLPAGSELDRFGGPEGNLTFAAKTPYEQRSLVPEWVNRPYHLYRVQRPLEALTGMSIPWFNQPGGGSAFILPASVEELLADGVLIELEPGEVPID